MGWAVRFRLIVDDTTFIAKALEIDADGPRGLRRLSARRSPRGLWWVDGKRRPDLDPCLDADVAATPLTNSPTIRRLGQQPGDADDIVVAWVDIPNLSIAATDQRYEREGADTYRFSSGGFSAPIAVDPDGLVREYAGLFARVSRH